MKAPSKVNYTISMKGYKKVKKRIKLIKKEFVDLQKALDNLKINVKES